MFMNSNSLPIALLQSLVVGGMASLKWDQDDTKEAMLGRGLTYMTLDLSVSKPCSNADLTSEELSMDLTNETQGEPTSCA